MSRKGNKHLFKERITKRDYSALITELSQAIDGGEEALTRLLFGTESPKRYAGSYEMGQHNGCSGLSTDAFTEKRLCKCMYYLNRGYSRNCSQCKFENRFYITGDYQITDYEVPAFYDGDGIGEIDLILTGDGMDYATEVKPYKNNRETLLRMIAEIMTYTHGSQEPNRKKAIAFFDKNRQTGEKTWQQMEYETAGPELLNLLKKAEITVFRFEEAGEKEYRICKL